MGVPLWDLLHGGRSASNALLRAMASFLACCWSFITTSLVFLLRLIKPPSIRSPKRSSNELRHEKHESTESESIGTIREESPAFTFKFPVMSPEEIRRLVEESCSPSATPATTIQSYRFRSVKDCTGFVQEPQVVNLNVEYAYLEEEERPPEKEVIRERDVNGGLIAVNDSEYNTSNGKDKSSEAKVKNYIQVQEVVKPDGEDESFPGSDGLRSQSSDQFTEFHVEVTALDTQSSDDESLIGTTKPFVKAKYLYQKDFFPRLEELDLNDEDVEFVDNCEEKGLSSDGLEMGEDFVLMEGEDKSSEAKVKNYIQVQEVVKPDGEGESFPGSDGLRSQSSDQFTEFHVEVTALDTQQSDDESLIGTTKPFVKVKYLYQKDFFPRLEELDLDDEDVEFVDNCEEKGLSSDGSELGEDFVLMEGEMLINGFGEETEADLHDHGVDRTEPALMNESNSKLELSKRPPRNKVEFNEKIEEMEDAHVDDSPSSEEGMIELMEELSDSELTNLELKEEGVIEPMEELSDSELTNLEEESDSYDDSFLESLWEHQDLVEQLKMELKKVRSIGLPTIMEECENAKPVEEPIPWQFEEKFLQEDPMDELQKFYKSYRERMRKFDILNYQKMYAMGFLNLKDELPRMWMRRSSLPYLLHNNFRLYQPKKSKPHPLKHLVIELHNELEKVYVGQACLSWEFLQWQYSKAKEMAAANPNGRRPFNTFVGELQQFQVLLQRFLENEPFQGPRVLSYVKNRCIRRNLLQVPYLREDAQKDKKEAMLKRLRGEDEGITRAMVVKMIEDSMRIFWEFVHADKEEVARGLWVDPNKVLKDSSDSKLLSEIRLELHKKERKLKELTRASQCLVKVLKKKQQHQEADQKQEWLLAQVDLRLVSRLLRMCEPTTDQLIWCQNNLSRINISDRRVHREQSFLPFPC